MSLQVQTKQCRTCIYRPGLGWNIASLEAQIADPHLAGHFAGYRECHHAVRGSGVVCRGFWNRHKDQFDLGQLAQRLDAVEFVTIDSLKEKPHGASARSGRRNHHD